MRRIGGALAAVIAIVAIAVLGASAPARAAGDLELSRDGVHYTSGSIGSIFPANAQLVPGETARGTFWLRNNSAEAAWLSIAMSGVDFTGADYSYALTLNLDLDGERFTPHLVGDLTTCTPLIDPRLIQPGASMRVDVAVEFGDVSGTSAQRSGAGLSFVTALSQGDPGDLVQHACPAGGLPALATASSENVLHTRIGLVSAWAVPNTARLDEEYAILIPMAALTAGAVLAVYARRRRQRSRDEDGHE